jgi:outer membrane protein OmpA-like peptidoglycan-associated protein
MGILITRLPIARGIACATALAVGSATAQRPGHVEVGAFGSFASYAPRYELRIGWLGGGRLAYVPRPGWSVELEGSAGRATVAGGGRSIPVTLTEVHVIRELAGERRTWYASGGYARPVFRGTPPGRFHDDALAVSLGRRSPLSPRFALRAELRGVYTFSPHPTGRGAGHLVLSAGVSWLAGARGPADTDGDGVADERDACRRTPPGATVDARGCPWDSDADGHPDGLDRCPNTPLGAFTDGSGCPLDSDNDGVYDGADQCLATPAGTQVDLRGCPADEDGDGVDDGRDRCPASPPGTAVDETGCARTRDEDGDGVDDARDRCPETPAGVTVDDAGCRALFGDARHPVVLLGVTFATNSVRLEPASFAVLDQVAASLLANPEIRIEIAGYTDSTGSVAGNRRLSTGRAEAVRAYLERRGVAPQRMLARGYGSANPVATNQTAEGRSRNRRVELRRRS